MAKVVTQEGMVDLDRLQDASQDDHWEDDSSPDQIADNDVQLAISQVRRREEAADAEDRYTRTVLASHGTPEEALPQTQAYLNDAWQNPIGASFALLDHYKGLPKPALFQKPPEEPKYDHPDEFENIRRAIRWSAQQEEQKQAVARARRDAQPAFDAFKQQYGDHTPRILNRTVDLHREMSDPQNAGDQANRLPLELIGAGMELQKDAAGLQSAHTEIEQFFDKYPKAQKYRDKMAHLLKNGGANTLEEAAGRAAGLWPIRHKVNSEANRADIELDVREARGRHPERADPPRRRVYSEAEQDVWKAVKDLRGE